MNILSHSISNCLLSIAIIILPSIDETVWLNCSPKNYIFGLPTVLKWSNYISNQKKQFVKNKKGTWKVVGEKLDKRKLACINDTQQVLEVFVAKKIAQPSSITVSIKAVWLNLNTRSSMKTIMAFLHISCCVGGCGKNKLRGSMRIRSTG